MHSQLSAAFKCTVGHFEKKYEQRDHFARGSNDKYGPGMNNSCHIYIVIEVQIITIPTYLPSYTRKLWSLVYEFSRIISTVQCLSGKLRTQYSKIIAILLLILIRTRTVGCDSLPSNTKFRTSAKTKHLSLKKHFIP